MDLIGTDINRTVSNTGLSGQGRTQELFRLFAQDRRPAGTQAGDAAMTWIFNFLRQQDVQKYLAKLQVDGSFHLCLDRNHGRARKLDVAPLLATINRVMNVIEGMVDKVAYVPAIGNKAKLVLGSGQADSYACGR